jgi:hypothetical protein
MDYIRFSYANALAEKAGFKTAAKYETEQQTIFNNKSIGLKMQLLFCFFQLGEKNRQSARLILG